MSSSQHSVQAQAAVLRQFKQQLSLETVSVDAPREGEIRVRIVGAGICHTDIVVRDGFPVSLPMVLGHEGAGVVESIGPGVHRIKPGDHVVLSFASCHHCPNCNEGQPAYCYNFVEQNYSGKRADGTTSLAAGGEPVHGFFFGQSSFARFAVTQERHAVVVPKELPLEILGPLGCGVQTGAGAAINSLGMQAGDSLTVFGGGSVGLSAVLGARAIGAGTVIVVEPNAARAALARELGATHTIDPRTTNDIVGAVRDVSGGGTKFALDTTAIPAVAAAAAEVTLVRGMVGLIGVPAPEAVFSTNMLGMLARGLVLKNIIEGDSNPQEFIPRMISMYREGRFPFDRLIKQFPFSQINDAIHACETGAAVKPVVVF